MSTSSRPWGLAVSERKGVGDNGQRGRDTGVGQLRRAAEDVFVEVCQTVSIEIGGRSADRGVVEFGGGELGGKPIRVGLGGREGGERGQKRGGEGARGAKRHGLKRGREADGGGRGLLEKNTRTAEILTSVARKFGCETEGGRTQEPEIADNHPSSKLLQHLKRLIGFTIVQ